MDLVCKFLAVAVVVARGESFINGIAGLAFWDLMSVPMGHITTLTPPRWLHHLTPPAGMRSK